jgi:hypothetical protein
MYITLFSSFLRKGEDVVDKTYFGSFSAGFADILPKLEKICYRHPTKIVAIHKKFGPNFYEYSENIRFMKQFETLFIRLNYEKFHLNKIFDDETIDGKKILKGGKEYKIEFKPYIKDNTTIMNNDMFSNNSGGDNRFANLLRYIYYKRQPVIDILYDRFIISSKIKIYHRYNKRNFKQYKKALNLVSTIYITEKNWYKKFNLFKKSIEKYHHFQRFFGQIFPF